MPSETWRRFYAIRKLAAARINPGGDTPPTRVERIKLLHADFASGEPDRIALACMIAFICGSSNLTPLANEELLDLTGTDRGVHPLLEKLRAPWEAAGTTPFHRMLAGIALAALENREMVSEQARTFKSWRGAEHLSDPIIPALLDWTYHPEEEGRVEAALCGLGRVAPFTGQASRDPIEDRANELLTVHTAGEVFELLIEVGRGIDRQLLFPKKEGGGQ